MTRWWPNLQALAAHKNVTVKISGACTLPHEAFPYKDIWDPLGRIFDAFGFDRCMLGTDWTRATGLLTYEQGVEASRVTDRLSESDRAALMGNRLSGFTGGRLRNGDLTLLHQLATAIIVSATDPALMMWRAFFDQVTTKEGRESQSDNIISRECSTLRKTIRN
jgi:hypothetical protein